ncbi:hypothetical protein LDO32_18075 [Luteimonas sp. Y-2-2-4F]|nr:hypothetical protein [Luteimonas sp. Y-2-2-4F]MCD9033623.1 hypothetical protein [Luteimonas sp. Y-2-2-4F]
MKGTIMKAAASVLVAAALGASTASASVPTYECTPANEGDVFHAVIDPAEPSWVNAYYCRGGTWHFLGTCQSGSCPSPPEPGGPGVET